MAEATQMNRHDSRKTVFTLLFAKEFFPETEAREFLAENSEYTEVPFNTYIVSTFLGTVSHMPEIDGKLEESAVKWKVSRMAKVTRSILRLAAYELIYAEAAVPPKVVINEAVELAKEFDEEAAPSFINGILHKIAQEYGKFDTEAEGSTPETET